MTFLCANPAKPTVELLKLSGVQRGDGIRHAAWFADSVRVDCSDSEVVGVSFEQPRHWVFTNFNGVIIALGPVFSSNLTSERLTAKETVRGIRESYILYTQVLDVFDWYHVVKASA